MARKVSARGDPSVRETALMAEIALLRESNHLHEQIICNSPVAIAIKDLQGHYTFMNRHAEMLLGLEPGAWKHKTAHDVLPAQQADLAEAMDREVIRGDSLAPLEFTVPLAGVDRTMVAVKFPLHDSAGATAAICVISTDVTDLTRAEQALSESLTERNQLEGMLRQAQRMEAVGRLAGGVAHDFNNLLTAQFAAVEMLLGELEPEHPARAEALELQATALRAAELTKQLLAFSRRQILQPRVLDLNSVVGDMDKLLRRLIGADVELMTVLAPDLRAVRADPGQIEQVIANLAVNSRDAMPAGGRLTIQTENAELDAAFAAAHPGAQPGRHAMLAVSDTGEGMGPEILDHAFEPFFTTKAVGKGTGLGLATVYGIVKQSGGYISVESAQGRGTTFRVYLPAFDAPE